MNVLSDINKLRLEMNIFQAKVKGFHSRGYDSAKIAEELYVPEKSIRVIIKWLSGKGKL